MTLTEVALKNMSKDDIISLALDYQDKFNSTLGNINKDIGELKYTFGKPESELVVSNSVNSNLCKNITTLERQCWANNQYSRRECLEISGIPENNENKDSENLTFQIFEKIDISVDLGSVEDCHWVNPLRSKQVILRLSKGKDANKIRAEKKKLKGKSLTSLGNSTPVYIKNSLRVYYKNLWAKCKKLHNNKLIHALWTSNGSIKLKVSENGNIHVITHDDDLEELFPNNELIKDIQRV